MALPVVICSAAAGVQRLAARGRQPSGDGGDSGRSWLRGHHNRSRQPVHARMSTSVVLRPTRSSRILPPAEAHERSIRRRVALCWGLLFLNVLPYTKGGTVIPLPNSIGKAITQGSLSLALLVALSVNPRLVIRRNLFLSLMSVLAIDTIVTAINAQYLRGTSFRTFRFVEFVIVLWLLTPFWGRKDMLLVRYHLKAMFVVLITVGIGYFIGHGDAMSTGRLTDSIWPAPATQVAHYAAVSIGIVIVLWMCRMYKGRSAFFACAAAAAILLLTHTRTAIIAMVAGLLISGMSMVVTQARVRKAFAAVGAVVTVAILTLSRIITSYLTRGQTSSELTGLSGRQGFWTALLSAPRTPFQEIFGFGITNGSFNGNPIDSNWLLAYQEEGLLGDIVCGTILLVMLVTAFFTPRGVQRALALFLLVYCLLASFTEDGFADASTYLLDMAVAASLLVPAFFASSRPDPEPEPL